MSPGPIDPASALKKLFDRRKASRATPEALFSSTPGQGPTAPSPEAGAKPSGLRSIPFKQIGQKIAGGLKALASRIPIRSSAAPGGVIGLDLGTSAVKVIRVEPADKQLRVTAAVLEELPVGPTEELAREALVGEKLRNLKRKGILNGPIVLNFHHTDSVMEVLRLPKMPAKELEQAVLYEARERLSLKPDRSVIRYLTTGTTVVEGQEQLEILLISAPKEPLLALWRLLAEMGLKVVAMEPTSLAAFYPLMGLNLWKPTEIVGHLEIGLKISHLSLIRGDTVRFNRSFPVAGDSVTQAIADYCQVDYEKAEELKRQYGISKMALEEDRHEAGHEAEDRVRVSHALGLHLEQLVAEIEHSYRYFAFELGGTDAPRMDRLLITGGGGMLKYLPEFLESRLTVPAQVVDPLRGLQVDPSVQEGLEAGSSQRLAVPIGLALRRVS